ncbi:hypothetical protein [Paenibacillus sp. FSL H8-0537]|uniref:hypothetical protein n=1 Tax=Paenibacillus sp. FSL H8-0537 TaxID=2921399 RepID=UPI003101167A
MIKIKPVIEHEGICRHCGVVLANERVLWQGIHVCVEACCPACGGEYVEDLKVGHATTYPYLIDLSSYTLSGHEESRGWLGNPLLHSLQHPTADEQVRLEVEIREACRDVVIINCIDFLYGHSLLKLLNAERERTENPDIGIIVLVQSFMKWMVPDYAAEVWTVNVPLSKAQRFYPQLDEQISAQCERFEQVFVSRAYSHPSRFNIEHFTKMRPFQMEEPQPGPTRITFIWREDRVWLDNPYVIKAAKRYKLLRMLLKPIIWSQRNKIVKLFSKIRKQEKDIKFSVVGLGRSFAFPDWIDDCRVSKFNLEAELMACEIYASSAVIVGVHGSNMLLPSALGGMVVNLMPADKWGNFAQDILFTEENNRISAYMYRFLPLETKIKVLGKIISSQISGFTHYHDQMKEDIMMSRNG